MYSTSVFRCFMVIRSTVSRKQTERSWVAWEKGYICQG